MVPRGPARVRTPPPEPVRRTSRPRRPSAPADRPAGSRCPVGPRSRNPIPHARALSPLPLAPRAVVVAVVPPTLRAPAVPRLRGRRFSCRPARPSVHDGSRLPPTSGDFASCSGPRSHCHTTATTYVNSRTEREEPEHRQRATRRRGPEASSRSWWPLQDRESVTVLELRA